MHGARVPVNKKTQAAACGGRNNPSRHTDGGQHTKVGGNDAVIGSSDGALSAARPTGWLPPSA